MTKLVTFARDMRPHSKGGQLLVPDDVAERLLESGDVSSADAFPPETDKPAPAKRYVTKDRDKHSRH